MRLQSAQSEETSLENEIEHFNRCKRMLRHLNSGFVIFLLSHLSLCHMFICCGILHRHYVHENDKYVTVSSNIKVQSSNIKVIS